MKLNLLSDRQPFSSPFVRSLRVEGAISRPGGPFLRTPKEEELAGARTLFSSRGEFKIDGEGEPIPLLEKKQSKKNQGPSELSDLLKRLRSIVQDMRSLQGNIEGGEYGTNEESELAKEELKKLEQEYEKVVQSDQFRAVYDAIQKLRRDPSSISDEELFPSERTLIGAALGDLAKRGDVSKLQTLSRQLERISKFSGQTLNESALSSLENALQASLAIDGSGDEQGKEDGALSSMLSALQDTVRKLRFIKEGLEKGLFTEPQIAKAQEEERSLTTRFQEVTKSTQFKDVVGAVGIAQMIRGGGGGVPAASLFAKNNSNLLGEGFLELLQEYRFGDLDGIAKSLVDISNVADKLSTFSSAQLDGLSKNLGKALGALRGDTLSDDTATPLKQTVSLVESQFERMQRQYSSRLVDEVDEFFDVIAESSDGAYTLFKKRSSPAKSLLDIFA